MLNPAYIRENVEEVKGKLSLRGVAQSEIDAWIEVDKEWREKVMRRDELRAKQREAGDKREIEVAKSLKEEIRVLEDEIRGLEEERGLKLEKLPNLPDDSAPAGAGEEDNVTVREVGEKFKFDFEPRDHVELMEGLGLLDMEKAAWATGTRFGYLFKEAALLEMALVNLAFKEAVKEGFVPVVPPAMIKEEMYRGMGRLAGDQKEERYYLPADDLYLIGSAEHMMGPIHAGDIMAEESLPVRYVGFSSCFRREAGSYGRDTRGILRMHQFDKVELFSFVLPEKSKEEHQFLLSFQERLVNLLGLPYRVVEICTGDMGFTDAKAYDIEIWMPGQVNEKGERGIYRETHSCSNTTDFQARGINTRFKRKDGGLDFTHLLNATGFAIGRTIISIMENYQQEDGSVVVPEILREGVGKDVIGGDEIVNSG